MSGPRLDDLLNRGAAALESDEIILTPTNPDNWPNMNVQKQYVLPSLDGSTGLSLVPVTEYYDEVLQLYLAAVNRSYLYQGLLKNEGPYRVLPYRTSPTDFWLSAEVGEQVTIDIEPSRNNNPGVRAVVGGRQVIIPASEVSLVPLQLGLGENTVIVRQLGRIFRYQVNLTRLAGVAWNVSKAAYDTSWRIIKELREDLLAPISSRLLEHTLYYADLIPDIRTLKIMGVRGSTLARVLHASTELGVRVTLNSVLGNTADIRDIETYPDEIDPADDPSYLLEQRFAKDAFIWAPNRDVVRREALLRLAVNLPEVYALQDHAVREVVLDTNNTPEDVHQFEHPDFNFLTSDLLVQDIAEAVSARSEKVVRVLVCGVQFAEHKTVDRCAQLGRRFLDCGDNLDDPDLDLDTEDDFDPASDGWVDFPLTEGHLDPKACIGIKAAPVPEKADCCWLWGPPMTLLQAQLTEPDPVVDAAVQYLIEYLP